LVVWQVKSRCGSMAVNGLRTELLKPFMHVKFLCISTERLRTDNSPKQAATGALQLWVEMFCFHQCYFSAGMCSQSWCVVYPVPFLSKNMCTSALMFVFSFKCKTCNE
jgi:hypothetical protein